MVKKLDGNGMRLRKSKLALAVLFSALLLAGMVFDVVQTSAVDASSWDGEDNIVNEASVFFDDSYIHEIRLYFDDADWYDTLYAGHDSNRTTSDPYFPARFESHNITIDPVGVRFKGLSTFGFNFGGGGFFFGGGGGEDEDIKKPFRIDFNMYDEGDGEETTFFGLKKLNLNNGALDPSMIREKLFMDFASNYVPAPRSVFTRVYVNDEYYGLYLAMEHIDNTYVESRFGGDESGNLYKVEQQGTLAYLGPDPESYHILYELKNNEEINDWSDLIWLTNVLTNTPIAELPDKLEPILDVESAMYSIALLDLFVSGDSYIGNARNYYLYHRSDTGQFTHLLWDANLVFGNFGFGMGMGSDNDPTRYSVFPPSTIGGFGFGGGGGFFFGPPDEEQELRNTLMLIERVMAVESYNRTYLRALAKMLREGFDADSINARIQELADLIRDEVYNDPNLWTDPTDFEPELEAIVDFVEKRAAYVDTQLNVFAKKADLQLNDLMTVNYGTIADNRGDYDPWVEIYNLGPGLVNTRGLFLTDDSEVPNKWELPTQNLDDGEFVLLWLDDESTEGAYHAPFRLNSGGGDLYLYLSVGSGYVLVDSISYPVLDADVSFGRFPDGEGVWHVLDEVVTPALANQFDALPEHLYINEFMANNDAAVAGPYNDYPDWIELYNGGTEAFDLGGMYMTDDLDNPDDWQFPSNTVIDAGGYLVIWADNLPERGLLHASFGLNASGESIGLCASDGETLIDWIVFDEQFDDVSYGRLPDGASSWSYLTPTPSLSNSLGEPVTPGDPAHPEVPENLYINEFMANNDAAVAGPDGDYPDWIELYNGGTESIDLGGMYLTGNLGNPDAWPFPEGTVIDAGGFLVVWADNDPEKGPLHASFSLSARGEAIGLFASDGETEIDSVVFEAQFDDVSYGRLPDGTAIWVYLTPTPGSSNELGEVVDPSDAAQPEVPENLYINEFMANNDAAVAGPDGDYPDWIELYNGGTDSIDVGGMYLTDNLANPDAWQFSEGTVIDAGGFLVVWADNDPEKGPLHASFGLNASGEAVGLFASDGETEIDSVVFNAQFDDVSYGRLPDGTANWTYLLPTPGLQNEEGESNGGPTEPVDEVPEGLVINEFMADNAATIAGPDGNSPDWIELYNGGNESVNLGGMYLTDDLNDPMAWQFPNDTIIEAEGFLLIWADNASVSDGLHCGFGLRANGESIALFASDGTTLIDSITYTKQLQDVSYGRLPDGSENWEHLLSATPGWGNNKRQYDAGSSLWTVLLLVGLVGAVCAVFVVGIKLNARRK
jgi:spore coat protein CotH